MATSTARRRNKRWRSWLYDRTSPGMSPSMWEPLEGDRRMNKPKPERKQVRPVEQTSIINKRFERVASTSKRVIPRTVHALMVLADLRKGSLTSLTRYLAQEGGIPDRAVAIELRKLISGSVHRSRYRLLVVEHPDRPRNKGGRPSKKDEETLDRCRRVVAIYERFLPRVGHKAYIARERVAKRLKCDDATVRRAIRSVRRAQKKAEEQAREEQSSQQAAAETMEHRRAALANLMGSSKIRAD